MAWLEAWKKNEMWKIILTNPRGGIETDMYYRKRIGRLLANEIEQYAKLGHKVHSLIEAFLKAPEGGVVPVDVEDSH